jgi:hypothetical protein
MEKHRTPHAAATIPSNAASARTHTAFAANACSSPPSPPSISLIRSSNAAQCLAPAVALRSQSQRCIRPHNAITQAPAALLLRHARACNSSCQGLACMRSPRRWGGGALHAAVKQCARMDSDEHAAQSLSMASTASSSAHSHLQFELHRHAFRTAAHLRH